MMECRVGCGACCIAISISSPIPLLPNGKPGGVVCPHLTKEKFCSIFLSPDRPTVCDGFKAERAFCGDTFEQAMEILSSLEK